MSPIDKTIFGYHFRSNDSLQPTYDKVREFLNSPKKEGLRELRGSDLEKYAKLVQRVQAYQHQRRQDSMSQDLREKMLFGVLSHCQFAKPTLQSTVEHYKYYVHAFQSIDFKKPKAFIASAEAEMARLNPKIKSDAAKLFRFQQMVNERKKTLAALSKSIQELNAELTHVARYVRDNLVKISNLCRLSIDILTDPRSGSEVEQRVIGDINVRFKDQPREHAKSHSHRVKHGRDKSKSDVSILSREITSILQEDISALTKLYKAVLDHVSKTALDINSLIGADGNGKNRSPEEARDLFLRIEQALVSLVSDYHFELKKTVIRTETDHESFLAEKREQMIEDLFELLQRERRIKKDRRASRDRRALGAARADSACPDKRSGKDRRCGENRRKNPAD